MLRAVPVLTTQVSSSALRCGVKAAVDSMRRDGCYDCTNKALFMATEILISYAFHMSQNVFFF